MVPRRTAPSALTGYSIAGLCGHLAWAVLGVERSLDTRLVELVVHRDDVAASLGEAAGDLVSSSDAAYERVAGVLARLAARRFGGREVVRGLARRQRHPDAVRCERREVERGNTARRFVRTIRAECAAPPWGAP